MQMVRLYVRVVGERKSAPMRGKQRRAARMGNPAPGAGPMGGPRTVCAAQLDAP